jgi:hypothetical protein
MDQFNDPDTWTGHCPTHGTQQITAMGPESVTLALRIRGDVMLTVGWYMGVRVQVLGQMMAETLEQVWLEGTHSDESGEDDGPGGHLLRIEDHLVMTDNDGNMHAYRALPIVSAKYPATGVEAAIQAVETHRRYAAADGTYAGL